ncbi:MAG TPA: hypothetical protein PLD73_05725 [Candidatus Hydrogenedentes bacterium]|jgi:tetratricopeptide (TPR) repeat protein|nr:hypothetical protein [Candidatus Hydrogenedentota bacterium]HPJ98736.1 hypothetical protein [Candidatus Hydrogenedentota bacterium]
MSDRFNWLEFSAERENPEVQPPQAAPHDAPSFYQAARSMREAAHLRAACDYYRKAAGLNDQHYEAWSELIDTLVRRGQLDEADRVSSEILQNYRQVRLFYASRALVLAHRHRTQEAFPLISVALEGDADAWYPRCVMGELLVRFDRGKRCEAQRFFDQAIERAKDPWEPYFLAGWAFLHTGLPALAAGHLAEAAHFRPRAALCWLYLGDSFRALRLYDQAQFYYQCAQELEPDSELSIARQKDCGKLTFGLMRLFSRNKLRARWKTALEDHTREKEWEEP